MLENFYQNRPIRIYKDYAPVLRSERFGLMVINKNEIIKLFDIPKDIINDNERQRRVYSADGISPTILGRADTAKILMEENDE